MKLTRDNRSLMFTDIPSEIEGLKTELSELEVDVRYRGDGNAAKGIILDHAIIPVLAESVAMLEIVKHLHDFLEGGSTWVSLSSLVDSGITLGDAVRSVILNTGVEKQ